jgi:hypothetical protein
MKRTTFPALICPLALAPAIALAPAGAVRAQQVFSSGVEISDSNGSTADLYVEDKTTLDGNLCVGAGCSATETYGNELIRLKHGTTNILFDDSSPSEGSFPWNDWRIVVNENIQNGLNLFGIEDVTGGTMPFAIEAGAPDGSIWVDHFGSLGIGTSMPEQELHIAETIFPGIVLEQTGQPGWLARSWQMVVLNPGRFAIYETDEGSPTFVMESGADADQRLTMWRTGMTSVAANTVTSSPDARFYVGFDDGSTQVKIEEASAQTGPRTLLNLQNNGRPEIVLGNTDTGDEWSFGAGTNFILKQGAVGSASSAKTKLFEVDPSGNATLTGSLVTGGTACGGGCDRVFTEEAIIPARDYAAAMWEQGYLPHVGPTPEGAPLNVSEKLGGMLNALEHAHVFIDRLSAENRALRAELAQLRASSDARLARLEAALGAEKR